MKHDPPDGVRTVAFGQKLSPEGIEKLAAFAPVIELTPVMVAADVEPFVMFREFRLGLPTEANWKFSGFGFATTAVEPLACTATLKGLPAALV